MTELAVPRRVIRPRWLRVRLRQPLAVVGAVIALTMIVAKMVHNWRNLPTSVGMGNAAVMMADNRIAPR